jgi:hypothetical protein
MVRHLGVLLVAGALLSAGTAVGKCLPEEVRFTAHPQGVVLPLEPVLLTHFTGRNPSGTPQFGTVDGKEWVPGLVVLNGRTGSLIKPERPLRPGRWRLVQDGLEAGVWTVVDLAAGSTPTLTGHPSVGDVSSDELGCGSTLSIPFTGLDTNAPDVFIEATFVTNQGVIQTFFAPQRGSVTLGHGMCDQGLSLPPGGTSVVFTPLDRFGQRGTPSATLTFQVPGFGSEAPAEGPPWALLLGGGLTLLGLAAGSAKWWRSRHPPRRYMSVPGMPR